MGSRSLAGWTTLVNRHAAAGRIEVTRHADDRAWLRNIGAPTVEDALRHGTVIQAWSYTGRAIVAHGDVRAVVVLRGDSLALLTVYRGDEEADPGSEGQQGETA